MTKGRHKEHHDCNIAKHAAEKSHVEKIGHHGSGCLVRTELIEELPYCTEQGSRQKTKNGGHWRLHRDTLASSIEPFEAANGLGFSQRRWLATCITRNFGDRDQKAVTKLKRSPEKSQRGTINKLKIRVTTRPVIAFQKGNPA